jgi:hypothetical protein
VAIDAGSFIMSRKYGFVLLLGLLVGPTSLNAQGANSDLRIIGLPVLAADGIKIGQVADVSKNTDGHIDRIRVLTGSVLGFGERVVEIPQPAFRIRDSNVLLSDFTAEMVAQLPSAASENDGPASQER